VSTKPREGQYVSAVSYGRYVLFSFETSDLSLNLEQELKAAITVPVKGVPVKAEGSTKIDAGFKKGSIKSKGYILGGAGGTATMAINSLDALLDFIKTGGKYSIDSPGRPISYNLRYLSDNSPVKVVNATEYIKKQCSKIYNTYRVSAESFELNKIQRAALNQIDLSGKLSAKDSAGGESQTLWGHRILEYPIRVNDPKNINASVEVSFDNLKPNKRKNAYIEIGMEVWGSWAFIREPFYPRSKKVYLHDLSEGSYEEKIKTQWHELTITYKVSGVED